MIWFRTGSPLCGAVRRSSSLGQVDDGNPLVHAPALSAEPVQLAQSGVLPWCGVRALKARRKTDVNHPNIISGSVWLLWCFQQGAHRLQFSNRSLKSRTFRCWHIAIVFASKVAKYSDNNFTTVGWSPWRRDLVGGANGQCSVTEEQKVTVADFQAFAELDKVQIISVSRVSIDRSTKIKKTRADLSVRLYFPLRQFYSLPQSQLCNRRNFSLSTFS